MTFPEELYYAPTHTWARVENDGTVTVGITEYAQYELGELQYLGLPRVGKLLSRDEAFGEAESTKTVSDLHAPCAGEVAAVNERVVAEPALVNASPYADGWLIRLRPSDVSELETLWRSEAYAAHTRASGH